VKVEEARKKQKIKIKLIKRPQGQQKFAPRCAVSNNIGCSFQLAIIMDRYSLTSYDMPRAQGYSPNFCNFMRMSESPFSLKPQEKKSFQFMKLTFHFQDAIQKDILKLCKLFFQQSSIYHGFTYPSFLSLWSDNQYSYSVLFWGKSSKKMEPWSIIQLYSAELFSLLCNETYWKAISGDIPSSWSLIPSIFQTFLLNLFVVYFLYTLYALQQTNSITASANEDICLMPIRINEFYYSVIRVQLQCLQSIPKRQFTFVDNCAEILSFMIESKAFVLCEGAYCGILSPVYFEQMQKDLRNRQKKFVDSWKIKMTELASSSNNIQEGLQRVFDQLAVPMSTPSSVVLSSQLHGVEQADAPEEPQDEHRFTTTPQGEAEEVQAQSPSIAGNTRENDLEQQQQSTRNILLDNIAKRRLAAHQKLLWRQQRQHERFLLKLEKLKKLKEKIYFSSSSSAGAIKKTNEGSANVESIIKQLNQTIQTIEEELPKQKASIVAPSRRIKNNNSSFFPKSSATFDEQITYLEDDEENDDLLNMFLPTASSSKLVNYPDPTATSRVINSEEILTELESFINNNIPSSNLLEETEVGERNDELTQAENLLTQLTNAIDSVLNKQSNATQERLTSLEEPNREEKRRERRDKERIEEPDLSQLESLVNDLNQAVEAILSSSNENTNNREDSTVDEEYSSQLRQSESAITIPTLPKKDSTKPPTGAVKRKRANVVGMSEEADGESNLVQEVDQIKAKNTSTRSKNKEKSSISITNQRSSAKSTRKTGSRLDEAPIIRRFIPESQESASTEPSTEMNATNGNVDPDDVLAILNNLESVTSLVISTRSTQKPSK
jgi:hypothetical protein